MFARDWYDSVTTLSSCTPSSSLPPYVSTFEQLLQFLSWWVPCEINTKIAHHSPTISAPALGQQGKSRTESQCPLDTTWIFIRQLRLSKSQMYFSYNTVLLYDLHIVLALLLIIVKCNIASQNVITTYQNHTIQTVRISRNSSVSAMRKLKSPGNTSQQFQQIHPHPPKVGI